MNREEDQKLEIAINPCVEAQFRFLEQDATLPKVSPEEISRYKIRVSHIACNERSKFTSYTDYHN